MILQCVACTTAIPGADMTAQVDVESPVALSPGATFGGREALFAEYDRASAELSETLPGGARFPQLPPGEWEEDGRYEQGVGEISAALYWRCAWLIVYINSVEDDSRTIALDALASWTDLPSVAPHIDQETRDAWPKRVIQPARVGDDALLRQTVRSC